MLGTVVVQVGRNLGGALIEVVSSKDINGFLHVDEVGGRPVRPVRHITAFHLSSSTLPGYSAESLQDIAWGSIGLTR